MKHFKFLLLALVALVGSSAWGQAPTEPTCPFTFVAMADDGETEQYLYNVDAMGFLKGANDWNTRASVETTGYKFKVKSNGDGTWTLNDYVETQSAWKAVFAGGVADIWVDNTSGANVKKWVITSIGDNKYEITNQGVAGKLCIGGSSDTRLYLSSDASGKSTWAFVNASDYDANKDNLATYKTDYATYLTELETYRKQNANEGEVVTYEECTFDNWTKDDTDYGATTKGDFHENTWSTEGRVDGSLMLINFCEYWVAKGSSLSATKIKHNQLTGYKPGLYTVSLRVRAYNEGSATTPTGARVSANGTSKELSEGTAFTYNGMAGVYANYSFLVEVTEAGTIDVDFDLYEPNFNWVCFKDLKVVYTGSFPTITPLDLTDAKLNATIKQAYLDAVDDYQTAPTLAKYATYQAAEGAVNASIAVYEQIAALNTTVASTLDAAGQTAYAATLAKYNNGELETYEEALAAARTAALAQTTANADMTMGIVNPDFETGSMDGWTLTGAGLQTQNNTGFDKKVGNYYAERWHSNQTYGAYQTITGLQEGYYTVGVLASYGGEELPVFYVNDESVEISTSQKYELTVHVTGGELTIGVKQETAEADQWFCVDNFTLTYLLATLPDVTAVEGQMNADVATTQTNAVNAYNTNRTVANYNAVVAAIAAAQASKDAYAAGKVGLDKVADILAETNVYTAEAYSSVYGDAWAAYNAGTWADKDASEYTNATFPTGWHAANTIDDLLLSAWGQTDYKGSLYINTWSTEGNTDGSGMTTPFFEYWTSDANTLSANTWTATMTDIAAGTYKVSALVRVRQANNKTDDPTGITINVNGGTAVDVCAGTECGTNNQFRYGTFEAYGVVGEGGELKFNFVIADGNNISWLSFKNVKYTKVEDREVVLGTKGINTFSSVYDVVIPEGVDAYYATSAADSKVHMKPILTGKIPANTGVVLKGDAGEPYTFVGTTGAEAVEDNLLVAVSTDITDLAPTTDKNTNFVLVGGLFCPFTGTATVNAGKAYLSVLTSDELIKRQGADGKLILDFGDETGVAEVAGSKEQVAGNIFDLMGRKVSAPVRGNVYIVNGKKYIY